jgi:glucose-1-phosphate adenylyltransferase
VNGNLIILAGGISSRMKRPGAATIDAKLTQDADVKAKSMIGVGGGYRPFLDYLLYEAREAGYRDIVIVVGERDHSIREYYGEADSGNAFHELSISYAIQWIPEGRSKPLGTADALLQGLKARRDWAGKKFTVCNSDNLYTRRALRLILESPSECSMIDYDRAALEFEPERIEQFAVIATDARGAVVDILEKPSAREIERLRDGRGRVGVSMNIFAFAYDRILPFLDRVQPHPVRQEKEIPTAVKMLISAFPGILTAIPLAEHVPDLTNRSDIVRVQEYLLREYPSFTWT